MASGACLGLPSTTAVPIPKSSSLVPLTADRHDGICCSYGDGSYALSIDGVRIATGGDFQSSATEGDFLHVGHTNLPCDSRTSATRMLCNFLVVGNFGLASRRTVHSP